MDCGNSFTARRLVRVMDELIVFYGKPRAIRMDNGPEMTSDLLVSWSQEQGIEHHFIQPGKPNQNAYVERFNKSVRTEVLNAWLFHSLGQTQEVIEDWREDYNGKEFGDYKAMDHSLDTRFYFAYPFSGLKRGSND
jgi:putative transposase